MYLRLFIILIALCITAKASSRDHTVEKGETLYSIAKKYGVAEKDILILNKLPLNGNVKLGQRLVIPARAIGAKVEKPVSIDVDTPKKGVAIKEAPKTIIASKEDKKVVKSTIPVVPKDTVKKTISEISSPNFHIVKEGETIFSIAKLYNVKVKEIIEKNETDDIKKIIAPGYKLILPKTLVKKVEKPVDISITKNHEYFLSNLDTDSTIVEKYDFCMKSLTSVDSITRDSICSVRYKKRNKEDVLMLQNIHTSELSTSNLHSEINSKHVEKPIRTDNVQKIDAGKLNTKQINLKPIQVNTTKGKSKNKKEVDTIQKQKSMFYFLLAKEAVEKENYGNIEPNLKKSLQLNPNNSDALNLYGEYYGFLNKPEKAVEYFNKALAFDKKNAKLYYNKGVCEMRLQNLKVAEQDLAKAIQIDSAYTAAYTTRGNTYIILKKYENAEKDFKKAISLNPQNEFSYIGLGITQTELNNPEDAIKSFDKSIEMNARNPLAYHKRGIAKVILMNILGGCVDLNRAIDMGYEPAQEDFKKYCK